METPHSNREASREHNWRTITAAVEMYRSSLELYRRMLELAAERSQLPRPALSPPDSLPNSARSTPRRASSPSPAAGNDPFIVVHPAAAATLLEQLTPREREVARLMAQGYTNLQIARELVVTRGTAANHVAHILDKLGLANRTQVAAFIVRGVPEWDAKLEGWTSA